MTVTLTIPSPPKNYTYLVYKAQKNLEAAEFTSAVTVFLEPTVDYVLYYVSAINVCTAYAAYFVKKPNIGGCLA